MRNYYGRLLKRAFTKSIGLADLWTGIVGAVFGVIDHYWPASQLMNSLAWQVPVWAVATLIVMRLLLAPYWLAKEDAEKILELENKLKSDEHKVQLESFYIEAGELLQNFPDPFSMLANYKGRVAKVDEFTERVSVWINGNFGPAARSRFLDLGAQGQEGDAAEWKLKLRRINLARLIESGSWRKSL